MQNNKNILNMSKLLARTILEVWNKAKTIEGCNPDIWRQDFAGAWIRRDAYGSHSLYGWEVDHLRPISKGGTNELENLEVLHWRNNLTKNADYPKFRTIMTSDGDKNIIMEKQWEVR